jgi:hypothetical protein
VTAASSVVDPRESSAPRLRSRALRVLVGATLTGALLTGLIGVLHLPAAAPLLRRISPAFACPLRKGTPDQIDRGHALGVAAIRASATSAAPARPALGFALDRTRRADIEAWASRHGVSCAAIGGNDNLQKCVDVPASAVGQAAELGPLEEVCFEFKASGELVNVQAMRRHLGAADAARVVGSRERTVAATVGAPTLSAGEATAANLGRSALASYVAEHTFIDYRATVSATNLAHTGVMVREEYLSAR